MFYKFTGIKLLEVKKEILQNFGAVGIRGFGTRNYFFSFHPAYPPPRSFGSDSLGPSHVVLVFCDLDI